MKTSKRDEPGTGRLSHGRARAAATKKPSPGGETARSGRTPRDRGGTARRWPAAAAAAACLLLPAATELRLARSARPLIRLAAYWNRLEPEPGSFRPDELDRQLDAADRAGKQVIVCVGPVKAFGYPEFFVPQHHLDPPLREGALVTPDSGRRLLDAGTAFVTRVVQHYRGRAAIIAWQVEHEAVDPLGMEHSWRLSEPFVRAEVEAVRAADPGRPVMMHGFLPTSTPVRLQQRWRTR